MSPKLGREPHGKPRFPRVSGDEPTRMFVISYPSEFSPRERG